MHKHTVGNRLLVKLSAGRIVQATIKAIVDTTEGMRLQFAPPSRPRSPRPRKIRDRPHSAEAAHWDAPKVVGYGHYL